MKKEGNDGFLFAGSSSNRGRDAAHGYGRARKENT